MIFWDGFWVPEKGCCNWSYAASEPYAYIASKATNTLTWGSSDGFRYLDMEFSLLIPLIEVSNPIIIFCTWVLNSSLLNDAPRPGSQAWNCEARMEPTCKVLERLNVCVELIIVIWGGLYIWRHARSDNQPPAHYLDSKLINSMLPQQNILSHVTQRLKCSSTSALSMSPCFMCSPVT